MTPIVEDNIETIQSSQSTVERITTRTKGRIEKIYVGIIIVVFVIAVAISIPYPYTIPTNALTTTASTSTTSDTSTTSTTTVTSTTSAACTSPFVWAPASGACVNTLINFNNCGSVGYVCSSNFTSCSYGNCGAAPAVMLQTGVNPTGWGGSGNVDDAYLAVTVPFNISMYNVSTASPAIQSNGVICLGTCSTVYSNTNLPSSSFSGATVFGFWDDLYLYSGTSQSIYYGTTGTAPNRDLVFEYYASHYGAPTQYYRFQIIFFENAPGIVQFLYYQASDNGNSATIGVQGSGTGPSLTYSYNTASIPTGTSTTTTSLLTLTFNTNTNTMSSSG